MIKNEFFIGQKVWTITEAGFVEVEITKIETANFADYLIYCTAERGYWPDDEKKESRCFLQAGCKEGYPVRDYKKDYRLFATLEEAKEEMARRVYKL